MNIAERKPFDEPLALDMLAEFRKECAMFFRGLDDRYKRDFDHQLNVIIGAFVREAVAPWQQAMADAYSRQLAPVVIPVPPKADAAGEKSE